MEVVVEPVGRSVVAVNRRFLSSPFLILPFLPTLPVFLFGLFSVVAVAEACDAVVATFAAAFFTATGGCKGDAAKIDAKEGGPFGFDGTATAGP